jgi:hypothetical protein
MSESTVPDVFSDEGIIEDIHHLIRDTYGARMSREHFHVRVQDGVVIVSGHLASTVGHEMLIENLAAIDGVIAVDDEKLYNDPDLRLEISQLLPRGLRVLVNHGAVALSGRPSPDADLQALIGQIGEIPGVVLINTDSVVQR